ncbi:MAG: aminofutalosine synthase MqnE [Bacteroidales bacterium]|nr:aminofutalosine synthase MqnE [Bacteroidales bacterium]
MYPEILISDEKLKQIANKVLDGNRISLDEGVYLYDNGDLSLLGFLANTIRERKNGNNTYFNRNLHIEPTNTCVYACKFCSYYKKKGEDGWEYSQDQIVEMVRNAGSDITEVHIVGGVHPKWDVHYYGEIFKQIKSARPDIHIKAFTAVEISYISKRAGMSVREGLQTLKEYGLDSIPGGGAEIFDEEIRKQICGQKDTAEQWLLVHQTAHELGIPSNATNIYGHIENNWHRVEHINRLRDLQDKTNGFNVFIPLKFKNKNNELSYLPEVSIIEDVKMYAMSRIYLDNFPHIKAYWPMIGRDIAQLLLSFGVDDFDGTINDSTKIYSRAGANEQSPAMTTDEMVELIKAAGRKPIERDSIYNVIKEY